MIAHFECTASTTVLLHVGASTQAGEADEASKDDGGKSSHKANPMYAVKTTQSRSIAQGNLVDRRGQFWMGLTPAYFAGATRHGGSMRFSPAQNKITALPAGSRRLASRHNHV
jgi:hypothetical protein